MVTRTSDSATLDLLAELSDAASSIRTVMVSQPGVVAALNTGLASARGDVIAVTDDDAVPRPDWLAHIERHFASAPTIGGVGGRDWVHEDGVALEGSEREVGRVRWYGRLIGNHHLGVGGPRPVDVLKGASMSFRRVSLTGIKVDPRLRGKGAHDGWEIGLSLAVQRRGWTVIYDPAVAVDHYPASRAGQLRGEERSARDLRDVVHNETLGLLSEMRGQRRIFALAYALVVGTRDAPGLVSGVERMAREQDRHWVAKRLAASTLGRWDGLLTWRRSVGRFGTRGTAEMPRPRR